MDSLRKIVSKTLKILLLCVFTITSSNILFIAHAHGIGETARELFIAAFNKEKEYAALEARRVKNAPKLANLIAKQNQGLQELRTIKAIVEKVTAAKAKNDAKKKVSKASIGLPLTKAQKREQQQTRTRLQTDCDRAQDQISLYKDIKARLKETQKRIEEIEIYLRTTPELKQTILEQACALYRKSRDASLKNPSDFFDLSIPLAQACEGLEGGTLDEEIEYIDTLALPEEVATNRKQQLKIRRRAAAKAAFTAYTIFNEEAATDEDMHVGLIDDDLSSGEEPLTSDAVAIEWLKRSLTMGNYEEAARTLGLFYLSGGRGLQRKPELGIQLLNYNNDGVEAPAIRVHGDGDILVIGNREFTPQISDDDAREIAQMKLQEEAIKVEVQDPETILDPKKALWKQVPKLLLGTVATAAAAMTETYTSLKEHEEIQKIILPITFFVVLANFLSAALNYYFDKQDFSKKFLCCIANKQMGDFTALFALFTSLVLTGQAAGIMIMETFDSDPLLSILIPMAVMAVFAIPVVIGNQLNRNDSKRKRTEREKRAKLLEAKEMFVPEDPPLYSHALLEEGYYNDGRRERLPRAHYIESYEEDDDDEDPFSLEVDPFSQTINAFLEPQSDDDGIPGLKDFLKMNDLEVFNAITTHPERAYELVRKMSYAQRQRAHAYLEENVTPEKTETIKNLIAERMVAEIQEALETVHYPKSRKEKLLQRLVAISDNEADIVMHALKEQNIQIDAAIEQALTREHKEDEEIVEIVAIDEDDDLEDPVVLRQQKPWVFKKKKNITGCCLLDMQMTDIEHISASHSIDDLSEQSD